MPVPPTPDMCAGGGSPSSGGGLGLGALAGALGVAGLFYALVTGKI